MFHGRFTVAWETPAGDLPRTSARLIYLAVLCLERSLPMGGQVRVGVTPGAIRLAVEGRRTAPPAALWAHLTDGAPLTDLKPDGVQFALLRQALAAADQRLAMSFGESAVEIGIIADRQTAEVPT